MQALATMFGETTFVCGFITFLIGSFLWCMYVPAQLFSTGSPIDKVGNWVIGIASIIGVYLIGYVMGISDSININPVVGICYDLTLLMLISSVVYCFVTIISGKQYSFRSSNVNSNLVYIIHNGIPTVKVMDIVASVVYVTLVGSFVMCSFAMIIVKFI